MILEKVSLFLMARTRVARSAQQLRDDASNAERMAAYGESTFLQNKDNLRKYLGRFFKLSIVQLLANKTATALGYTIDRCSRRKFDILILWLFERWENVGPLFLQNVNDFLQQQAQPQAVQPQAQPQTVQPQDQFQAIQSQDQFQAVNSQDQPNVVYSQDNERLVVAPGIQQIEPGIEDQSTIIARNQEAEYTFNQNCDSFEIRLEENSVDFQDGDPFDSFRDDTFLGFDSQLCLSYDQDF